MGRTTVLARLIHVRSCGHVLPSSESWMGDRTTIAITTCAGAWGHLRRSGCIRADQLTPLRLLTCVHAEPRLLADGPQEAGEFAGKCSHNHCGLVALSESRARAGKGRVWAFHATPRMIFYRRTRIPGHRRERLERAPIALQNLFSAGSE